MPLKNSNTVIVLIVLAGILLRISFISHHELNTDETSRLEAARQPIFFVIKESFSGKSPEPNPPLFTLLLHFSTHFNTSETSIRTVPVVSGILAIVVIYFLGSRLYGQATGILATYLYMLSPFSVHYSLEAKQYSMMALFSLLVALSFIKCQDKFTIQNSCYYCLSSYGLLLTHYSGLFLLCGFFILYLFQANSTKKRWIALHILIMICYAPFIYTIFKILHADSTRIDWIPPISIDTIPRLFLIDFLGLDYIPKVPESKIYYSRMFILWFLRISVFTAIVFCFIRPWKKVKTLFSRQQISLRISSELITVTYLIFPLMCFIIFSLLIKPIYEPEYQVMIYPAFILIISQAVINIGTRLWKVVLVLLISAIWVWSLTHRFADPRYHYQPWRKVAAYFQEHYNYEDKIIFYKHWVKRNFDYYSDLDPQIITISDSEEITLGLLNSFFDSLDSSQVIWLAFCMDDGKLEQAIVTGKIKCLIVDNENFNKIRVYKLKKKL